MIEQLILNDGTEVAGHLIEADSRLFVYLNDITLAEAFELFNDPEKTKKIKAVRYGVEQTVKGYKHLSAVSEENNGQMISAMLRKG